MPPVSGQLDDVHHDSDIAGGMRAGQSLAFTAHASTVGIITSLDAQQGSLEGFRGRSAVTREVLPHLPMRTLGFLAEGRIVAAGFDGVPVLLTRQRDDSWRTSIISAGP